jgi:hypothetical protein
MKIETYIVNLNKKNQNQMNEINRLKCQNKELKKFAFDNVKNELEHKLNKIYRKPINSKIADVNSKFVQVDIRIKHPNCSDHEGIMSIYKHNPDIYNLNLKTPIMNNFQIFDVIDYTKPDKTKEFCQMLNKIQFIFNMEIIDFIYKKHYCHQKCREHYSLWQIIMKSSNNIKSFMLCDNTNLFTLYVEGPNHNMNSSQVYCIKLNYILERKNLLKYINKNDI